MKPAVVIAKVGSVFYTRKLAAKNSSVGEQGETEGIINHLLDRGDIQVIYFGLWRGDVPDGLIVIEPHIDGFDEYTSASQQQQGWAKDADVVRPYEPKAFINVTGYASTCCSVDNPAAAGVQACGIRYSGPAIGLMQSLHLPRICVNNDPRNYPREGEIVWNWDWCRPRAMLSQRTRDFQLELRERTLNCREVYCGAENWCEHIHHDDLTKRSACTMIAHAHIGDGCKRIERDVAFAHILAPQDEIEVLKLMGLHVYGDGWSGFCNYDDSYMHPPIKPSEVGRVLAQAKTCPAVAAGDDFYTGKLRTCLAQGCLPLFYGRGEPFTFDPFEKYVSLSDQRMRISMPGDLLRVVRWWDQHETERRAMVQELWTKSMPDWSLFDNCVNDVLAGRDMDTETWWVDYGGYR